MTIPDGLRAVLRIKPASVVLVAGMVVLAGCSTVPAKEFSAYRDTFDQARKTSEQVLLEYAANRKEAEEIIQAADSDKPVVRDQQFDAKTIAQAADPIDDVAIRMQAWEVVAQYNDVITLLAEGKPAQQVTAATEGLVNSLSAFPFSAVQDVAEKVTPVLGLLSTTLTEMQKNYDRKKAVESLVKVAPIISDQLIGMMMADAQDFYNLRYGINDRNFIKTNGELRRAAIEFRKLVLASKADDQIKQLVVEVNQLLAAFPKATADARSLEVIVNQPGTGEVDPVTLAQLQDQKNQIAALVTKGQQLDDELDSYRSMMAAYVRMLAKVDARLSALALAAERAQTAPPDPADLLASVIRVRRAYLIYQDKKQ